MAEVVLKKVSKVFPGNVVAVRDLDLHVADGEQVVLVGPSGCGKTTTLRMIAGLEEITSGTIRIGDRVVNTVHPKDRDVAMVFQDYALYPHMNVYKNMAFGLKLRKVGRPEIDRRVRHAAGLLDIAGLLDRMPAVLSGGQQQRVAVGRAIVREPQCSLFDEPLSNLDAKLRTQMRAELKALHMRLRTTIVYVTHDQEEAMTLGDRIVVMAAGRVQQIGAPLVVYHNPVNRFVAGFLGSPAMNFIDGQILRESGRLVFTDTHTLRLGLSDEMAASASGYIGRPVVLGVRPEALRPEGTGGPPAGPTPQELRLTLEITMTEPLGDRMDVYGKTVGGQRMIARVSAGDSVSTGTQATFSIDPAALHLFEPGEFGRDIALGSSGSSSSNL